MSIQIADISLAAAVVGTTGTITWDKIAPPPTLLQQMRPLDTSGPTIALFNESQCKLLITLPATGQSFTLPAGRWVPIPVPANERSLTYVVTQVAPGTALFTQLSADYFRPGEPVHPIGTLGNSPIGGSVVTTPSFPQRVGFLNNFTVTFTNAVFPLTYTTGATTEVIRVTATMWAQNGTSPSNPSYNVAYTDTLHVLPPPGISAAAVFTVCADDITTADLGKAMNGANTFTVTGGHLMFSPVLIVCAGSSTVTLQFQDAAGTPNYRLAAIFERVG